MKHSVEWILAGIGAITDIWGTASFKVSLTTSHAPGFSLYLMLVREPLTQTVRWNTKSI